MFRWKMDGKLGIACGFFCIERGQLWLRKNGIDRGIGEVKWLVIWILSVPNIRFVAVSSAKGMMDSVVDVTGKKNDKIQ